MTPPRILQHQTLHHDPDHYCAWPALGRAANGDLLLAFCRTGEHLHPSGQIVTMRSTDRGATWSHPVVAYDTPIDDRECGLTVLPDGRIVMHLWSTFWRADAYRKLAPGSYPQPLLDAWIAHVETPAYRAAESRQGSWVIVSSDHGHTWSEPVPGPDSVHGGVALQNGTILVSAYRHDQRAVSIHVARDPFGPWEKTAVIACPMPETHYFGEPHVAQLPSGRVLLAIRCTARQYDDRRDDLHLWFCYSDDQGRTWSAPYRTPMLGFPPHLTVLADGRALCTYGRRRAPFGERAAFSRDGVDWDIANEVVIRDDNANHDLGYPASIEIEPGKILSVYYQKPAFDPTDLHRHKVGIYATTWLAPTE